MASAEPDLPEAARHDSSVSSTNERNEFLFAGVLTVEDVLSAHRLATRGWAGRFAIAVLIVIVFSLVLFAIAVSSTPYSPQAARVMFLVACVVFPALLIVPIVRERLQLNRLARKQSGLFAPTSSAFSPTGIVITDEDARTEIRWRLFSHCVSNESVALLFFRDSKQYLIVARRKLKDPQMWSLFLTMVQAQLSSSKCESN